MKQEKIFNGEMFYFLLTEKQTFLGFVKCIYSKIK